MAGGVALVVVVLTRRAHRHRRSWRFGVFFESDDRYGDERFEDPDPPAE